MTNLPTLLERNRTFYNNFDKAGLPVLPDLRAVILTCGDARVDPAHILGLELGDAVVIRNNGGRVTAAVIEEIATLAFMVRKMDGAEPGPFELIIMQHTQCGAERFASPDFRKAIKEGIGVDVSAAAISNHEESIREDIDQLRNAAEVPGYVLVSGLIYDVVDGSVREVVSPGPLRPRLP